MFLSKQQRYICANDAEFIEKLRRVEFLSGQLSELLGNARCFYVTPVFSDLDGASSSKEQWLFDADWRPHPSGEGEVTYLTLKYKTKLFIGSRLKTVMQYQRDVEFGREHRHMFVLDDSVITRMNEIIQSLERRISKETQAIRGYSRQVHRALEARPPRTQEDQHRFDNIDLVEDDVQ